MKKSSVTLIVTLALSIILAAASRLSVAFSEWYAVSVYPVFRFAFSKVFGIFPFSVAEFLLAAVILAVAVGIVVFIVLLIRNKGRRKVFFKKSLLHTLNIASVALLIYMVNCGVNYNREPFLGADSAGVTEYTREDLSYVFDALLMEFERVAPLIHTDENGAFILTGDLRETAPAVMLNLSEKYPRMGKTFAAPKPVITSKLMSRSAIAGIFSPFTVEANYNNDMLDSEKPFTVCHELAHMSGFMKEEEANFISFLACRESGDPEFMYSAYLSVLERMSWEVDFDAYERLPEQAKRDLALQADYWTDFMYDKKTVIDEDSGEVVEVFVPSPITELSDDINDNYLKINGQEDGVQSYGRMIDLVIAVYLEEKGSG